MLPTNRRRGAIVLGMCGIVFGAIGFVGLAVGGDFGSFTSGMMPGVLIGLSLLAIIVAGAGRGDGDDADHGAR